MTPNTIALCLANEANDYQQAVKDDTVAAAAAAGIRLKVYSANDNVMRQVSQLHEVLHSDPSDRPKAVVVMAVGGSAVDRLARDLVKSGIGWISINRTISTLSELRRDFPSIPIAAVTPDQHEIGRIQGRQFKALLPTGGNLLYIHGSESSPSAVKRLEGMREEIAGSRIEIVAALDGKWASDHAERAVGGFLRMILSGASRVDLVGCQNDAMALGALNALSSVAQYLRRPEISSTPVTGCDGTPTFGKELVKQGKLIATVINPSTGRAAVELLVGAWSRGQRPKEEVLLAPESFPDEQTLARRS